MRGLTRWVVGALVFGCARPPPDEPEPFVGQSYCEALELICDVDQRAGLGAEADPIEKGQKREDYLGDHVKNPDAIYFRTLLKVKANTDKAAALREQAKQAGIERCAFAETVASEEF